MALWVWGDDENGQLGLGGTGIENDENIDTPQRMIWEESINFSSAALGSQHTLLLTKNGRVYSCGNNDYGQLSQEVSRKRPRMFNGNPNIKFITPLENYVITAVRCGSYHSMAINEFGQLYCWGGNNLNQCGLENDSTAVYPIPKLVKTLAMKQIVQIACGQYHSLALTNSGEIWSFGSNIYGNCGLGYTNEKVTKPTLVKSLAGIPIAFLACGGNHSFAISKSGAVFGWGKNLFGQIGVNDNISKNYPTQLKTLRSIGVRYIACGDDFSVFLTQDGGILTCGNGSFGQLGHGTSSNEILPRMVIELMGSTVSQISCGRRHTLTFVPSRKKIYGFGLSAKGQLGKTLNKSSLPQIVHGPWIKDLTTTDEQSDPILDTKTVIRRIFAGGDHCLVSLVECETIEPDDYRCHSNDTQIWFLTTELAKVCSNVQVHETLDLDLITSIEVIFKSLSCINSSFLLDSNKHFCCSSKNNGIDFKEAEKAFDYIRKIEHENLKELIWDAVTNDLLKSLSLKPADVETLRIYLVLPLYHEFLNSKNYPKLHSPFCKTILGLEMIPLKIVSGWFAKTSTEYFERLVEIFKDVIRYYLHFEIAKICHPVSKQVIYEQNFFICLNMLSLLYHINHQQREKSHKVPYELFHISEIADYFEIRQDYVQWCIDMNSNSFYLCNYPFVFDASAKMSLLQTDQALQMHNAMQNAANQSILALFGMPVKIYILLNVTRERIVEDTIRELAQYNSNDLKKPLKIKFAGEEGEDAGGVRKEFFILLLKDVLDPKYGMFKYYEDSRAIWFAEDSFESEEMYKLIGILCGLAIYNFTIINLPFPLALYKKLLNEPVDLSDLKELSPDLANSMESILDYDKPDFEEVFGINFEVSRTFFGENKTFPLKTNGENIAVTLDNKKEFVDLYIDFLFNQSVNHHFKGFFEGFMKVCGGRVLKLFKPHELMAVVIGNEEYDWNAFEQEAVYKNGYSSGDKTIRYFWEVFHELELSEKKKFLLYLTGSDRIPIQGMKAIKILIQPTNDEKFLPVAHTCFNLLDLPRYGTKEKLKYKLVQAIQQTHGFSLV